jgi:hypothetical protein
VEVLQETKNRGTIWPYVPLLGVYQKNQSQNKIEIPAHQCLLMHNSHTHTDWSIIHCKEEWDYVICKKMDRTEKSTY